MNFQNLKNHIEEYGCTVDHLIEESYVAMNCINSESCIIEDLSFYSEPTLCHYFHELAVPAPPYLVLAMDKYRSLRENLERHIESEESE